MLSEWNIREHDEVDKMRQEETDLVFNATVKARCSSPKVLEMLA